LGAPHLIKGGLPTSIEMFSFLKKMKKEGIVLPSFYQYYREQR